MNLKQRIYNIIRDDENEEKEDKKEYCPYCGYKLD